MNELHKLIDGPIELLTEVLLILRVVGFDEQLLQNIRNPPVIKVLQHLQLPGRQGLEWKGNGRELGFGLARNENIKNVVDLWPKHECGKVNTGLQVILGD